MVLRDLQDVLSVRADPDEEAESVAAAIKRLTARVPTTAWFREDHAAQRLTQEREHRGWSQEKLARELDKIGYSLPQSSISKIENPPHGSPRRTITVDDAVALATVFDLPLLEFLAPPGRYNVRVLDDLASGADHARQLHEQQQLYDALVGRVASEIVEGNIGTVVAAGVRDLFNALGAQDLPEALDAIETADPADFDEPLRYQVQFLRDVLIRLEHVKPKRRARGAYKGNSRKGG